MEQTSGKPIETVGPRGMRRLTRLLELHLML